MGLCPWNTLAKSRANEAREGKAHTSIYTPHSTGTWDM